VGGISTTLFPSSQRLVARYEALYVQIFSQTFEDVALRLGIEYTEPDSLLFAQSTNDWPLAPHSESCLDTLRTIPGLSIAAIADADHDSLPRTPAFAALAPSVDTSSPGTRVLHISPTSPFLRTL
jgi:hypothetical protein